MATAPPADMPIPDRLNLALVGAVFGLALALLWLGSHVEAGRTDRLPTLPPVSGGTSAACR